MSAERIVESLTRNARVCMRLQGSSMLPWVRPGDIAILGKISPGSVRCGDIVLFRRDDRFFVHRIVERCTRDGRIFLVTKGDANPHPDGVIAPSEILGRVERIYRGGRRIDLDTPGQIALGLLISQLSLRSRFWYPLARLAAIVTRPVRRLLHALQPSGELAR